MSSSAKVRKMPIAEAVRPVAFRERKASLDSFAHEQRRFIDLCFKDFEMRCTSQGFRRKYNRSVIDTMKDYFSFTSLGPWDWTEVSFDEWNHHLVHERGVKRKTQSTYQNHLRAFQGFLIENTVIQQRCQVTFGCRIEAIATRHNCITHKTVDGSETGRRNFSQHEEDLFLKVVLDEYGFRKNSANKGLFAAGRDLTLFRFIFDAGLRIHEALGIDVEHFDSHPDRPECGNFAKVVVWGKARKGECKPKRVIPINDLRIAKLLAWYFDSIRIKALHNCDAWETAFFLTERGKRLSYSAIWERFDKYKVAANLGNESGLTIHSTRHSAVNRDLEDRIPVVAVQKKAGHTSLATTGGYSHTSEQYVEESYEAAQEKRRQRLLNKPDK